MFFQYTTRRTNLSASQYLPTLCFVILGNLCGTLVQFLLSRYCESLIDCSKVPLELSYVPRLLSCIDTLRIVIQASVIDISLCLDLK